MPVLLGAETDDRICYPRRLVIHSWSAPGSDSTASGTLEQVDAGQAFQADIDRTAAIDLMTMLPGDNDVPTGLSETGFRERSLARASEVYTDPADMMERFAQWDWEGNVLRTFQAEDGEGQPDETTFLAVSIHRFGDASGAQAALDYALADEVGAFALQEVAIQPLGAYSRVIVGPVEGGNDVVLFVQRDNDLIVVDALSPAGDPFDDAVAVAETVLAK